MLHLYCTHNEQFNQRSYDNLINKFNITIHTMECPRCHAKASLIFYGHRVRKFIFVTRTVLINAQRCRCKECGAIHIILPSFVVPGFNHVYLSIRNGTMSRIRTHLIDTFFIFKTSFVIVRRFIVTMTVNPNCIVKCFDIFKYHLVCHLIINDLFFIQPLSFN